MRQDCSFVEKQESSGALLVLVRSRHEIVDSDDSRSPRPCERRGPDTGENHIAASCLSAVFWLRLTAGSA
jgi:hypothetical protein